MTTKGNSHAKPELELTPSIARFGRADIAGEPVIDREGGKFGAGIIRGVSLTCVAEAKGHDLYMDAVSIETVRQLAEAKGETGLKCRFGHGNASSDSIGKQCGRLFDFRVEDEKVLCDLHFNKASHKAPDGNLMEYLCDLVEEDPKAAGLSIVFHHDEKAEIEFMAEHSEEYEFIDNRGRKVTGKRFKSPDPRNENNYPHVRIAELRAGDIVDDPACGDGAFAAVTLPYDADRFLSYVCGISEDKPQASAFGIDGDRASQFLGRWLDSHGLSITPTKEPVLATQTNEPTEAPETPAPTHADFSAQLSKFTSKFGTANGTAWFTEGKTFEESLSLHAEALEARIEAAEAAQREAEEKLSSLELGETEPVATGATGDGKDGPKRFSEFFAKQSKN